MRTVLHIYLEPPSWLTGTKKCLFYNSLLMQKGTNDVLPSTLVICLVQHFLNHFNFLHFGINKLLYNPYDKWPYYVLVFFCEPSATTWQHFRITEIKQTNLKLTKSRNDSCALFWRQNPKAIKWIWYIFCLYFELMQYAKKLIFVYKYI